MYESHIDCFLQLLMAPPKNAAAANCLAPGLRNFILSADRNDGIKTEQQEPRLFSELRQAFLNSHYTNVYEGNFIKCRYDNPLLVIKCTENMAEEYSRTFSESNHIRSDNPPSQIFLAIVDMTMYDKPMYCIYTIIERQDLKALGYLGYDIVSFRLSYKPAEDKVSAMNDFSFYLMLLVGRKAWATIANRLTFLHSVNYIDIDERCLRHSIGYTNGHMSESVYAQIDEHAVLSVFDICNDTVFLLSYPMCFSNNGDVIQLFRRYAILTPYEKAVKNKSDLLRKYIDNDSECMKSSLIACAKSKKIKDVIRLNFAL